MGLFGKKKPRQVVGTPQRPVSDGLPSQPAPPPAVEPSVPAFDDPDDATRWKMVHLVESSMAQMMNKYQRCFEAAQNVEKGFAMANADFIQGYRQNEISKENFRKSAVATERELESLLGDLRTATLGAEEQWKDLVFLLPGSESDVVKLSNWCMSHGIDSKVMSSVVTHGIFIHTNYGLTKESFWVENDRVTTLMGGATG